MTKLNALLLTAIVILVGLSACDTSPTMGRPDIPNPTAEIKEVDSAIDSSSTGVVDVAETIDESINEIKSSANSIGGKIPADITPLVEPDLTNIENHADLIKEQTAMLNEYAAKLNAARATMASVSSKVSNIKEQVDQLAKDRDAAIEERDAAVAEAAAATQEMLMYIMGGSIIAAGICVAFMIFGSFKMGMIGLTASIATMALALTISEYRVEIAIGTGVLLFAVVGWVIYQAWQKQNALKEVVHTTEVAKRKMTPEMRKEVFGYREEPGIASAVQSSSTENIVDRMRNQMRKRWNHTVDDEADKEMDDLDRRLRSIAA